MQAAHPRFHQDIKTACRCRYGPIRRVVSHLAFLALAFSGCNAGESSQAVDDRLAEMATSIVSAWDSADLVCLGERHGSSLDAALRKALAEHPKFLSAVDIIVLESASGVHQQLIDRFILDGEELPRKALQPIWRDAGRGVVWELPIYEEFLRTVRQVNLGAPRSQRVRVIAGAEPIPWDSIERAEDLQIWGDRELYLEQLIRREVLDQGHKGLAVFGSFHCEKLGASFAAMLEAKDPGRFWSAFAFSEGEGALEGRARLGLDGAAPALVPITGTDLATRKAGASFFEGHVYSNASFGELLDAVISFGAERDIVQTLDEDALDPMFLREIARRDQLRRQAADLSNGVSLQKR